MTSTMTSTINNGMMCWTCCEKPATHSTFRDALGEDELTCDKCHRKEYPEQYEEEDHKKKKKKKKHKRLVIVPNKLCKSMECKLIKDEEWNMKCAVCDGYYKDDGLHDILDVNDDENCFCHLCGQGGIKSKNLVIMKDTGSVTCRAACLEDDFCECDVCGEELHEDESFRLYGSNSMTFCKECYADRL